MPITDIQHAVLRLLAANRSPDSYLAGATVLHRSATSPRYSQDLDLFHDIADRIAQCAEQDARTLTDAGYEIEWSMRTPTFYRAVVTVEQRKLKMEWAQDSTFRFFPIQPDPECGHRLHEADAATNKMLALAGRREVRDYVDILHLHETYLSLGALAWAACGKDPGYTPEFLIDQASRHVAYTQHEVDRLHVREPLAIQDLKRSWLAALEQATQLVSALPLREVGCLYLDAKHRPVTPDPVSPLFPQLRRHYGEAYGTWPTIQPYEL